MLASRQFENIVVSVENSVAVVELNRPDKLNAFTPHMYSELRSAVRLADISDEIEFIVIRGRGRAFASGGDLTAVLDGIDSADPLDVFKFEDNLPFESMRRCSKVLIAEIDGLCFAAGVMITSICDISVASERSTFCIPEGRVGLPESWIPSLLFGRVPLVDLQYLMLTAKVISAARAREIGLITEVVGNEAIRSRVDEVVDEVRNTTPEARALYKEYLRRIRPTAEVGDIYRGFSSPRTRELLARFAGRG